MRQIPYELKRRILMTFTVVYFLISLFMAFAIYVLSIQINEYYSKCDKTCEQEKVNYYLYNFVNIIFAVFLL